MSASGLETLLLWQLRAAGLPEPEREARLIPGRRWRVDFWFPAARLAVEVEGGVWLGGEGRHTSGAGFTRDAEKYNRLALAGVKLLRVTRDHIDSGAALAWIRQGLEGATTA